MHRDEIERLLPTMYQMSARPGSPLEALLEVMDDLHRPPEERLDDLDSVFDPYRAPDRFVPWLTKWLGLDWLVETEWSPGRHPDPTTISSLGNGRLRDLVAIGHALAQWRGTEVALVLLLTTATGLDGFSVDEPADRPFHIVVTAPGSARPHEAVIRRSIQVMKPAAATAELVFTDASPGAGAGAGADDDQEAR